MGSPVNDKYPPCRKRKIAKLRTIVAERKVILSEGAVLETVLDDCKENTS